MNTGARKQAKRILGNIASGEDLHAVRAGKRQQATVKELAERYMQEHAIPNKKPSSVKTDQSNLKNHVIPYFGDLLVKEVTLEHVDKFMSNLANGKVKKNHSTKRKGGSEIAGGHGVANRCRALLSKMFSLAEKWRVIPQNSNPVKHATKFKENTVEQYLSDEQMTKLGEVLEKKASDGTYSVHFINAIRLLLLTGARLGEVQSLKWEHIDHQRRIAFLPDSKTGKKPLPLNEAALEVINSTPQIDGNAYVFAGKNEGEPIVNFRKAWGNIRKEADLNNFRLHDLRHNFASAAINAGTPLAVVGALLVERV
jgi:integrase